MRETHSSQIKFGEVRIEDIELELDSRDDIPAILIGLQHIYKDVKTRTRLFDLLEAHILPGVDRNVGRPGLDMWQILVIGVLKQGLGCDIDRLRELVNKHKDIQNFLGHSGLMGEKIYNYQTIKDNIDLLTPELLEKVNQLIVESGHTVAGKKPKQRLSARCDSFVVETDVHYPTDVNLLWDAMRSLIRTTGCAASDSGVRGWRQWKKLEGDVRRLFHKVRRTSRAGRGDIKQYLRLCRKLVNKADKTLPHLIEAGLRDKTVSEIRGYTVHARRQIDQVERRLLQGETISHDEKVFSIYEPHTRWISKGKAGCPVELGVPVSIMEDHHGFILHQKIMWTGSDVDYAVPMVKETQAQFPELRNASFDRGFYSPENRDILDGLLDNNVMPKKGYLSKVNREREQGKRFKAMRGKHPGVESAINNLEHRGLDRVRSKGKSGFARSVALSVLALNVHRIGLLLRRKAASIQRRAA